MYTLITWDLHDPFSQFLSRFKIRPGCVGWFRQTKSTTGFNMVDVRFDYFEYLDDIEVNSWMSYNTDSSNFATLGDIRKSKYTSNIKIYELSCGDEGIQTPSTHSSSPYSSIIDEGTDFVTGFTIINEILSQLHGKMHLHKLPFISNDQISKSHLITKTYNVGKSRNLVDKPKFDTEKQMREFFEYVAVKYSKEPQFQKKVLDVIFPDNVVSLGHEIIEGMVQSLESGKLNVDSLNMKIQEMNRLYSHLDIDNRLLPVSGETENVSITSEDVQTPVITNYGYHILLGDMIRELRDDIENGKPVILDLDKMTTIYNKTVPDPHMHIGTKSPMKQTTIAVIKGYECELDVNIPCTRSSLNKLSIEQLKSLLEYLTTISEMNPEDPRLAIMNDVVTQLGHKTK